MAPVSDMTHTAHMARWPLPWVSPPPQTTNHHNTHADRLVPVPSQVLQQRHSSAPTSLRAVPQQHAHSVPLDLRSVKPQWGHTHVLLTYEPAPPSLSEPPPPPPHAWTHLACCAKEGGPGMPHSEHTTPRVFSGATPRNLVSHGLYSLFWSRRC